MTHTPAERHSGQVMKSVPPASAGGSIAQLSHFVLDPPAYAGGTETVTLEVLIRANPCFVAKS
jgi:hypothetical protein